MSGAWFDVYGELSYKAKKSTHIFVSTLSI